MVSHPIEGKTYIVPSWTTKDNLCTFDEVSRDSVHCLVTVGRLGHQEQMRTNLAQLEELPPDLRYLEWDRHSIRSGT